MLGFGRGEVHHAPPPLGDPDDQPQELPAAQRHLVLELVRVRVLVVMVAVREVAVREVCVRRIRPAEAKKQ